MKRNALVLFMFLSFIFPSLILAVPAAPVSEETRNRENSPLSATHLLTIDSSPGNGALIYVSPSDDNGEGNGFTGLTRQYPSGTVVSLSSIPTYNGRNFKKWIVDGVDNTNPDITLTMDQDHVLTAVYGGGSPPPPPPPPAETRNLSVSSEPSDGVSIVVSPKDNNGFNSGVTSL